MNLASKAYLTQMALAHVQLPHARNLQLQVSRYSRSCESLVFAMEMWYQYSPTKIYIGKFIFKGVFFYLLNKQPGKFYFSSQFSHPQNLAGLIELTSRTSSGMDSWFIGRVIIVPFLCVPLLREARKLRFLEVRGLAMACCGTAPLTLKPEKDGCTFVISA